MARLLWKKPAARDALTLIGQDVAEFFGIPAPVAHIPDYREGMDWQWRFDHLEVWTKAGRAELDVSISARFAHLYFRFADPARAVIFDDALGRLNRASGKWNAIATPGDYAKDGAPCPATSLDVFRANLRRDFRRVAEPNPPVDEVAAYRALEAERKAAFAAYLAEMAAPC